MDDDRLAAHLATVAGEALLALRERAGELGDELRAEGDRSSQALLARELGAARPDDAVLSEEAVDDPSRLAATRVWIIDPLDGTREFGELERDDWAVHVALAIEGRLTAGAVALPALGTTLSTAAPPRARAPRRPLRVVVSRSRAHPATVAAVEALGGELLPMGSAGAKAMAVVRGDADVYLHAGGQYEWDSAAPAAVAAAAGLHVSTIRGERLVWNKPEPLQADLLVCHPDVAREVLGACRDAGL